MEERQAAAHPTHGSGEGNTWRSLACKSLKFQWIYPSFWSNVLPFFFVQAMEGSMLTISLGIWMELPGVNYRDLTGGKHR